jgi:sugar O-acyltransferase (sialic acid O-acetyltransferase NeuD family)
MPKSVFVFGASGHAKVVIDVLRRSGGTISLLVDDDNARRDNEILGCRVLGGRDLLLARRAEIAVGIVAIGDNDARLAVAAWLRQQGFGFVAAIDPAATVSEHADIGPGALVMPQAVVNADARIGGHAIINTAATVDHDCIVGEGAHMAPGCHLCGGVQVGAGTLLGAGTIVVPGVRIGAGVVVGAGSTVLADIPDGARAAGSPCRILEAKA